jgi:Spy/CpxP family protein refolding chaperone
VTLHVLSRIQRSGAPNGSPSGVRALAKAVRKRLFRLAAKLLTAAAIGCVLLAGAAGAFAQRGGGGGGMMGGGGRMGFAPDRGPAPREFDRQPPAMRGGPLLGLPGRWWDDGKTAKKLSLRPDQRQRMDGIFEANKGTLLNALGNLQHAELDLQSMSQKDLQNQEKVFAAIDRVAQARADLEKANAHYLMQIRQQMDPSQVSALDREIASGR